jgi:hypothetical protein
MKKEARKSKVVRSKRALSKRAPAKKGRRRTEKLMGERANALRHKHVSLPMEIPLQETKAQEAKYFTGSGLEPSYQQSVLAELAYRELAPRYDEDLLVLQVRDPWWAHAYWDLCSSTQDRLRSELSAEFGRARWVLRSYDISYINFDGTNAHRFFDINVDVDARNWYLNFGSPGTSWCVDLGLVLPDDRFITVVRSNMISLPLDGPSWVTDEEWMIPDDEFRRLYGMSVGLGPNVSSPVGKLWQERLKKDISSRGLASMGSPSKKPKEKGAFWLVVDTELIVYGATEADAHVTVQGRPLKLKKDGTFTLRFALPDGKQEIPVVAKSAKIDQTRTITPVVTRKTTRNK